ncbi:MAG: hypothetical protein HXX20_15170 [Chloroflexi bacterium]|nr:hypothetical protein [Chloroflexota bacterium]
MSLTFGASTVFILLVILIFLLLFFAAWLPLERGRQLLLRPLRSLHLVSTMAEQAAENGTTIHFSPGLGGLNGDAGTAEALNGLTMLSSIARLSARTRSNLVTTTNDALTYLTAGDTTRGEYIRAGREVDYLPEKTQFIAQQDRMAYMVGMRHVISAEEVSGTVLLGRFGSEYLLVGDKLAQRDLPQVVGSSQVEALPLMVSTAGLENVLIGEEIYAAPAYLDHAPSHLASLQVQDWLRGGIIVLIVLGLLVATFGITIGDYFLR